MSLFPRSPCAGARIEHGFCDPKRSKKSVEKQERKQIAKCQCFVFCEMFSEEHHEYGTADQRIDDERDNRCVQIKPGELGGPENKTDGVKLYDFVAGEREQAYGGINSKIQTAEHGDDGRGKYKQS